MRFSKLFLMIGIMGMSGSVWAAGQSLLICRGQQCGDAKYTMTKEYLFNQVADLFQKNIGKEVLICEADPVSHRCFDPALRIKGTSNMVKADISIPSAEILDAKLVKGKTTLEAILDFTVDVNNTRPRCQSSLTNINVESVDHVQMDMKGFDCAFTATGNSTLNMAYTLDYIDFDYGTMGAYYTIGSGKVVRGGKTGYALFRFTEKMPGTTFKLDGNKPGNAQASEAGSSLKNEVETKSNTTKKVTVTVTETSVDGKVTQTQSQSMEKALEDGSKPVAKTDGAVKVDEVVKKDEAVKPDEKKADDAIVSEEKPEETVAAPESFSQKWDRWTDKAEKVFYLDESIW